MDRGRLDLLAPSDPAVERIWRTLEAHAQPSYSLSWGWISNWLAALPEDRRPALAVMHDGHEPSAAFFLAQRRVRRNLVLQSNALYFNATGSAKHDELGIANNGMLAAPGARRSLAHVLEQLPADWDELHVPAVACNAFDDLGAPSSPMATRYKIRVEREAMARYVDLERVRMLGTYDALQTRRCMPGVDLEVASSREHALAIYGELLRLHPRGAWVEALDRRLIVDRFAQGEIQLLRVRSGESTLGCLFNVVYRGRVHSHHAGFAAGLAPTIDPALITHAAAIEYNARAGRTTYDVDDEELATGAERLVWLTIERPLGWIAIEDTARRWYDALVGDREPQLQVA